MNESTPGCSINAIDYYLPERVVTNAEILAQAPDNWDDAKLLAKTGVAQRHVVSGNETSLDLALQAGELLLARHPEYVDSVDYLIFCTQTPGKYLPSGANRIQHQLGFSTNCGALDVNQGCSGYVYSLSLARGLIASGAAQHVLVFTADTYTRMIDARDFATRSIFGDAGTVSSIVKSDGFAGVGEFVLGSDGAGADKLQANNGAFLSLATGNFAAPSLHMDGAAIMAFGLQRVPQALQQVLEKNGLDIDAIELFIFHQASSIMVEALRRKLRLPADKVPFDIRTTGNTVSGTIPIALKNACSAASDLSHKPIVLCGFGVGLSWAACTIKIQGAKL